MNQVDAKRYLAQEGEELITKQQSEWMASIDGSNKADRCQGVN
jgi:hypothetical protein